MRLAGVVCSPMPERRIEKAMMKRGKLVTITRMPGATDSTVSRPKVRMIQLAADPSMGMLKRLPGSCWAFAATVVAIMAPAVRRNRFIRPRKS